METLEDVIKDMNAGDTLKAVEYKLALRKPDGKENHQLSTLRQHFYNYIDYLDILGLREISFGELRERDSKIYTDVSRLLIEAKIDYNVDV